MDRLLVLPALRIALLYLLLSLLWIAVSDRVVEQMFHDTAALTLVQTWKGWGFVSATAILLGWLVHREMQRYARTRLDLDRARSAQISSETRYQRIFAESPLPAWIYDSENKRILAVNEAAIRHYGYSRKEWLKLTINDLQPEARPAPPEGELSPKLPSPSNNITVRHVRKDGILLDMEIVSHDLDFEGHPARMAIANDVTERRQAEERIFHLAYFDALTGLPNRVLLMERLRKEIQQAKQTQQQVILIFFDLDRFKDINDSLGHQAGDALLLEASRRLKLIMPRGGTVARMSADLYALLLSGHVDSEDARRLAESAMASLAGPMDLGSVCMVEASACAGIALYPAHGSDDATLMRNADAALHHAMGQGRNHAVFYQADMNLRSLERLAMENDMRHSLEQGHFVLHYQPQLSAAGHVTGVEALVRWNHPEHGLIAPGRFIPLAEESGLILPLGAWVLREACQQASRWLKAGMPITVAVNLSAIQFQQPRLVESVSALLAETGLPACYLELEVTESIIMGDTEQVTTTLQALYDMGLNISIDDFGTGYSSLAYLGQMAVSKLKIDQSFVRGIPDKKSAMAITNTIIALAKNLGLTVIAEGVETIVQSDFLQDQGCDEMQGYLFSHPLPATELEAFIRQRNPL